MRKPIFQFTAAAACALVLIAFLALGLMGCGKEERDYSKDLHAAAAALSEEGSAHALVNAAISPLEDGAGMALSVQGDAWIDLREPALEARFTVLGMEISLRYTQGHPYLKMGGSWYSLSTEGLGVSEETPSSLVDLVKALPEVLSASVSVDYLEDRKVGSFDCVELEVHPDFKSLSELEQVRGLAEDLGITPEELQEVLSASNLEIRVSVQKGDPVIRQIYVAADADLSPFNERLGLGLLPQKGRLELTAEFSEYGVEVAVEPPPEARPFKGL